MKKTLIEPHVRIGWGRNELGDNSGFGYGSVIGEVPAKIIKYRNKENIEV